MTSTRLLTLAVALIALTGCASTPPASPSATAATQNTAATFDPSEQVEPATSVLRSYEAALNESNVNAIVALYATDAVFMAQHRTPAVGHVQMTAYRDIFAMIKLDIRFEIDEVIVVSPTVAYARTRSAGKTTILANDAVVSEGNQELFVLIRENDSGDWKIGRYIFSTTHPRS